MLSALEPSGAASLTLAPRFSSAIVVSMWALRTANSSGVKPPFDFSVPGVTSVSVDLHKYAYSPKGVSVLLHRSDELRAPQYFAYADWPGYTVVNPTVASTRSGGPIAAAARAAPPPVYSAELQRRGGDALYRGDALPGSTGVLPEYQHSGSWIAQPGA